MITETLFYRVFFFFPSFFYFPPFFLLLSFSFLLSFCFNYGGKNHSSFSHPSPVSLAALSRFFSCFRIFPEGPFFSSLFSLTLTFLFVSKKKEETCRWISIYSFHLVQLIDLLFTFFIPLLSLFFSLSLSSSLSL